MAGTYCNVLGQLTSITLFVACVCAVYPKMSAIDFMPSQIANGTLSCIFVIVFTEAKSFLSSSLSVCHQPVYVQADNLVSQLNTEGAARCHEQRNRNMPHLSTTNRQYLKYLTGPTSEKISVSISSVTPYGMFPTAGNRKLTL